MIALLRRLIQRYGFHRQPTPQKRDDWQADPFYRSDKARRLAEIARQRDALKDQLAKAIKAKKARAPIYAALRALSVAELRIEQGKETGK